MLEGQGENTQADETENVKLIFFFLFILVVFYIVKSKWI